MANPNIKAHARKGGLNSGRRRMSIARWDEMLTPLATPADAKVRLEEIWLRAEISELDRQKIKELETRIGDLTRDLKAARAGIRVA